MILDGAEKIDGDGELKKLDYFTPEARIQLSRRNNCRARRCRSQARVRKSKSSTLSNSRAALGRTEKEKRHVWRHTNN